MQDIQVTQWPCHQVVFYEWYQQIGVQPDKRLVVYSGYLQVNTIPDSVLDKELEIE